VPFIPQGEKLLDVILTAMQGVGGTNTHIIMEQAKAAASTLSITTTCAQTERLFVISARDKEGVRTMASNLATYLQNHASKIPLEDLAYTLCHRRSKFNWTIAAVATSSAELVEELSRDDLRPMQSLPATPHLGFVFNGQGAQWFAMGRELLARYPVYADVVQECEMIITELGADWSVMGKSPGYPTAKANLLMWIGLLTLFITYCRGTSKK
jgi:acyl transferase domain-containing protein